MPGQSTHLTGCCANKSSRDQNKRHYSWNLFGPQFWSNASNNISLARAVRSDVVGDGWLVRLIELDRLPHQKGVDESGSDDQVNSASLLVSSGFKTVGLGVLEFKSLKYRRVYHEDER